MDHTNNMADELILAVDDETNITQLIRLYLEKEGFRVITSENGLEVFDIIQEQEPSLIILDLMLPGLNGLEVCRKLRAENNPVAILMLTAKDDDIDKILGLEIGADDYLTKPFNPRELIARVKAILRRRERSDQSNERQIRIGDLVILPARREVFLQGQLIEFRHQEFNLLEVLAEHKGLVMSREKLLNLAWGYDYLGLTRTVDVHIGNIRRKLKQSSVKIETIPSNGYKLVV